MGTVIREMAQRMEQMEQVLKEAAAKEAKLEKQLEEMVQERNNVAVTVAQVVDQAVKCAINEARLQPARRLQVQDSHTDRRDPVTDQMQSGLRYLGYSVSPNSIALIGTRQ